MTLIGESGCQRYAALHRAGYEHNLSSSNLGLQEGGGGGVKSCDDLLPYFVYMVVL